MVCIQFGASKFVVKILFLKNLKINHAFKFIGTVVVFRLLLKDKNKQILLEHHNFIDFLLSS